MALASLRKTLGLVKDNINQAQSLTTGPIPASPTMNVKKLKIPRRQDLVPEGLSPELSKGFVPAETLHWKPLIMSNCFTTDENFPPMEEQIILFGMVD